MRRGHGDGVRRDGGRAQLCEARAELFDSLPSIQVYSVDDHSLVSVFLHDQLAIHAPQIELYGRESLLAKAAFKEFATLWELAVGFRDIRSWSMEIHAMLRGRTALAAGEAQPSTPR